MEPNCPLCTLPQRRSEENVYYEDDDIIVVDAKNKKGHNIRIMASLKDHLYPIPKEREDALMERFIEIARPHFGSVEEFYVYGIPTTVKDHWHKLACLKDQGAEDYKVLFIDPRPDLVRIENSVKLKA